MSKIAVFGGLNFNRDSFIENSKKETIVNSASGQKFEGWLGKIEKQDILYVENDIDFSDANIVSNRITAIKNKGISHVIAITTCGSLREEICTEEFVAFHQLIDFTENSRSKLIQNLSSGKKLDVSIANPFSNDLRELLIESAIINGITIHNKGRLLAVSSPRKTTRAESGLYRQWNADIINDNTATEAIAANFLGIEYAAIGLCTDYDSWRTDIPPSTKTEVDEIIIANKEKSMQLLKTAIINFANI